MFEFFIFIVFLYITFKVVSKQGVSLSSSYINRLSNIQYFSNMSQDTSIPGLTLFTGNAKGENHLFATKNTSSQFTSADIDRIYEKGKQEHIHNIIIYTSYISVPDNLLSKIKEYNIQIWDNKKLFSLINNPTTSILQTSNTSDDTCKIDTNSFEPIQNPQSTWKSFFKKPDRL